MRGLLRAFDADRRDDLVAHLRGRQFARRHVLRDAQHDDVVGGDFDRVAHQPVLRGRVGERRALHRAIPRDAGAAAARERPERLHGQAYGLRRRFQRSGILVDDVDKLGADVVERAFAIGFGLFGHQALAHLVEVRFRRALHFAHLHHVPAELRAHRAGDLAALHREHRIFERLFHHAFGDPAQIAALRLRHRIVGVGGGELGEIGARRLRLGGELVRLRFGSLLLRGRRIGGHGDEDVRDEAFAAAAEATLFLFETFAQRGFAGRRHGERLRVDVDVFHRHLFRRAVLVAVRGPVRVDFLARHGACVRRGRGQLHERHAALFGEQLEQAIHFRVGDERRVVERARQRFEFQPAAHFVLEALRAQALRGERDLVTLLAELAVDLEGRQLEDRLADLSVADRHAGAAGGHLHDALVDQLFEDRALVLDRVERERIVVLALFLALLRAGVLELQAPVARGDFLARPQIGGRPEFRRAFPPRRRCFDLRDPIGVLLLHVRLHAEEGEGNREQAEDDRSDPAGGFLAEFLQHWAGREDA
ncbi:hypothetical protein LF41_2699 [Lysobacter dokdonensis DS-58]|uniref:NAD-specific glutamate dehydrogenase n=1 Tax=Lysobacter dokdonensis DS-58 TaxID=1300345 RepID=A0A0A2X3G0_9GAMM|nr:hypothetical protein LF41_2699 [Lysobacter dokdonensis DS-58]